MEFLEFSLEVHPFFNLNRTMDSEQCPASFFFWKREEGSAYSRIYHFKEDIWYKLTIRQENRRIFLKIIGEQNKDVNDEILRHAQELVKRQFRLDDDFDDVLGAIAEWPEIQRLFVNLPGLWLMRDANLFERFADSICSQNTSISHLNRMMNCLAQRHGKLVYFQDDSQSFVFPKADTIAGLTLMSLKQCALGYRAKYLLETSKRLTTSPAEWDERAIMSLSREDARKKIYSLPGVGPKVGSLILAFGYGRTDVFAVDVWVMRGLQGTLGWTGSPSKLQKQAEALFGDYSAYINNYLFYTYRRNLLHPNPRLDFWR